MKCFYHDDLDGRCAAFWVYLSAGLYDGYEPKFIEINYRDIFPLFTIEPNEQVYIVDYHISADEMRELIKITKDVTMIDHHKTTLEEYKDFDEDIRGVLYDGVSGAMLTYCYLHHMTDRGQGEIKPFDLSMIEDAPMFTKLVSDWDVWRFEYGDMTRCFKTASDSLNLAPDSDEWTRLIAESFYLDKLIAAGETMIKFRDQWAAGYMNKLGFEVIFEGHKCFAANIGYVNSEYFKSIDNGQYEIFIPFVSDGNQYSVSMYSKTVDVGEIAKKYGGGGHKGAAGFQCKLVPFCPKL